MTSRFRRPDRLVSYPEIAVLLSVAKSTPRQWNHRGLLPAPYATVRSGPVWWSSEIEAWAKQTGRWEY